MPLHSTSRSRDDLGLLPIWMPIRRLGSVVPVLAGLLCACSSPEPGSEEAQGPGQEASVSEGSTPQDLWFEDVSTAAGLDFTHEHGGSGRRYMIETLGSGGSLLDFDGDGWLDVYLSQGEPLPGYPDQTTLPDRFFHNLGGGRFEDVTQAMGGAIPGYGMGSCIADVDNDGLPDIYVGRFGPDRLLRNAGGQRFDDVTEASGIDNPNWTASCAFADYDADGCVDLYVVNYVDHTIDNNIHCEDDGLHAYCHPDVYNGVPDHFYRGNCDATFERANAAAGIPESGPQEGKGLGVVWSDLDDDGRIDLYVSNDSTRNFHFVNQGDGTFEEMGVSLGTAFNEMGLTEAGMGVDSGDIDRDGRFDLFVAHLDFETNTFYRNQEWGLFNDSTAIAGLAGPSTTMVGFGVELFDADNDGDLDLYVANGHIIDNIHETNPTLSFEQHDQLFENVGDARFEQVSAERVPYLEELRVGRGAPSGDIDNDGDLDLLVTNCNGPAALLRNHTDDMRSGLLLRLVSRHGGRDAIGAKVSVVIGDRTLIEEVRAGSGYLSTADPRIHFGLGEETSVDRIEVRWPDGARQVLDSGIAAVGGVMSLYQPN